MCPPPRLLQKSGAASKQSARDTPMNLYTVNVTGGARADLQDIFDYISVHDAPRKAEQLIEKLESLIATLAVFPERGSINKELRELGVRDYREVYFKPYRVIYTVQQNVVFVLMVVDGRRDMQTILRRRFM